MNAVRKRRSGVRRDTGWLARDLRRALIACLCLVSLFAFGAKIDDVSSSSTLGRAGLGQRSPSLGDSDVRTGSILLVPRFGDECRLRLIDNATWQIWENGVVDCQIAVAQAMSRSHAWSAARVDIIRDGFRKR
jgi:hypothetical protein